MKAQRGMTLTSLIIYIIAMVIIIGIITVLSTYFYQNIEQVTGGVDAKKEYTKLNSFLTQEVNQTNNKPVKAKTENNISYIVFSNGNQYTYQNGSIYLNKIRICHLVEYCNFSYDATTGKVAVQFSAGDNFYKAVTYSFQKSW